MLKLKIKKLSDSAVIPSYSKPGDAAMDLTATSKEFDNLGHVIYGTSLAFEIPDGHVGLIFPRSSIYKQPISLSNSVGVIDSSYRGEVKFIFNVKDIPSTIFYNEYMSKIGYEVGDRIGQIMIVPYPQISIEEVTELSTSIRGEGGFGHSGR